MPWQTPTWDRDLAVLAAARVDSFAETDRLFKLSSRAAGVETLQALSQLASRPDWPVPAIEAALLRFTNQLRQLPPFSVDPVVVDYLHSYQIQTLVAHDESPEMGVPLYPIRSAATGLVNHWTRLQATQNAETLISDDPNHLLSAYVENPDANVRTGIENALNYAGTSNLKALLEHGLPKLPETPELTGLLGKSALFLGDSQSIAVVMINGRGHALTEIARQASSHLPSAKLGNLLLEVVGKAPAPTAAMLIAELTPHCIHREFVATALMKMLDHRDLGSTAALALARWGSDEHREALSRLAASGQPGLAPKRAQTALSLARSGPGGSPR